MLMHLDIAASLRTLPLPWIRRLPIWTLKWRCSDTNCGRSARTIYTGANCGCSKSRGETGAAKALAHWWQTKCTMTRVQSQSWRRGLAAG